MPGAPRMKICGITGFEDAQGAVEAGAWALGLILWDGSPRACPLPEAELVSRALRRQAEICGVFVNPPLDEVTRLTDALGLTMVQLHGEEGPVFCDEVRRRTGAKIVKAAPVSTARDLRALDGFRTDFHLLDAHHPDLRGGTGETWDWELLAHRRSPVPLILSGGLTAENVGGAIRAVRPFAVDSASGTESAPGHKDPEKVAAFAEAVRAAGAELAAEAGGVA